MAICVKEQITFRSEFDKRRTFASHVHTRSYQLHFFQKINSRNKNLNLAVKKPT